MTATSLYLSLSPFLNLAAASRQRFTTSPAGLALEIPEITEIPILSEEPDVS